MAGKPLRSHSVGPQWRIVYFRFWESGIAGIIASYFIQNKIDYISLLGLQIHHIFYDNLMEVHSVRNWEIGIFFHWPGGQWALIF